VNQARCALAAHKTGTAALKLSGVEEPRHEPGQGTERASTMRADDLVGLAPSAPDAALPADPRNPVLITDAEKLEAFGEWWVNLTDEQRQTVANEHGNNIRALKDRGEGPTPTLPETWKVLR